MELHEAGEEESVVDEKHPEEQDGKLLKQRAALEAVHW
jgi:hypothetical protein